MKRAIRNDDISNMAHETQYTQKDVQLYQEDIITEDITVHTHHLHEVASGESSQKIDSCEMETPQESEHPDEQGFHIGAHFQVEENRSYLVNKQLEADKTKMEDEQEFHYYKMRIPHEEQFAVEQSKKDYNEEKLQHECVSLEGEEVHGCEDGSPPEKQFEVQQVRNDHKEQKSQEEKQLQVEQCESWEEPEKIQQERQFIESEEVHEHEEGSPHEEQFEVQQVRKDDEEKMEIEEQKSQQVKEELSQVCKFDPRPSLALHHLVDSNTFHFHCRHSRRWQKK